MTCLFTAGALTGFTSAGIGGVPLMCIGVVPLFLAARLMRPNLATVGGIAWGLGLVATESVLLDTPATSEALVPAVVAIPALAGGATALMAMITRRVGFHPLLVALLWLVVEYGAVNVGVAPEGILGRAQREHPMLGAIAAGLGSLHVAFLLALLTAGAVATIAEILRVLRVRRGAVSGEQTSQFAWVDHFALGAPWRSPEMPRAPPSMAPWTA